MSVYSEKWTYYLSSYKCKLQSGYILTASMLCIDSTIHYVNI